MIWFASIHDFFTMGGYAAYVWSSWGATVLGMGGLLLHARVERRRLEAAILKNERRLTMLKAQGEVRS